MYVLAQDVARSVRSLRKSVAFTTAAVATLALCIGATTAIFSVVESVLLRPLSFPGAERVVVPESFSTKTGDRWSVTYADFMDWRDAHVFAQVALYQPTSMDLTGDVEPVRVSAAAVTPQFFGALGFPAARGRLLQPDDFRLDAARAIVISDRLWRTQFGARPDIVGLVVEVNAVKRPVVGVLPSDARWPLDVDLWVPFRLTTEQDPDLQRRDNFIFSAIARLAPDKSLAQTGAVMATLARRVSQEHPDIRGTVTTVPTPVLESLLGATTPRALWILLGAVGLLLLIGCVNVANLQLARATARQRELALRTALGASRARLVRHTLLESGVLSISGGALGLLVALAMIKGILAIAPADVPRIETVSLSVPALGFVLVLSLGVAFLFGLVPAVRAARSDPQLALAEGAGGARTSGGRSGTRTRRTLVMLELALSVILLVGAGLAVCSISKLRRVDTGFDTRNVLTASISLSGIRYPGGASVVAFMTRLRERLASTNGVTAVGISSASPLGGGGFYLGRSMVAEGRDQTPAGEVSINWNVITPGYFAALRIPLLRGRDFTTHDDSASPPVIIVNEKFAKAMFPGENAIGKRVMSSRDERLMREIVAVVRDVKYYGASDSTRALVYVPYAQRNAWHQGIITLRAASNPLGLLPVLRREVKALDPGMALANVMTMEQAMSRSMASDRLVAVLLGAFASLALLLAGIGIFGVLSYMVAQRTRELGIRVALGAQRGDVVRLVARETGPMLGAGIVLGLGIAIVLARFIRSMFYDIQPTDPVTLVGVAVLLGVVGVVAALVPSRRAARVDPVIALRE
jgi:putative ABC transport system permease protein